MSLEQEFYVVCINSSFYKAFEIIPTGYIIGTYRKRNIMAGKFSKGPFFEVANIVADDHDNLSS